MEWYQVLLLLFFTVIFVFPLTLTLYIIINDRFKHTATHTRWSQIWHSRHPCHTYFPVKSTKNVKIAHSGTLHIPSFVPYLLEPLTIIPHVLPWSFLRSSTLTRDLLAILFSHVTSSHVVYGQYQPGFRPYLVQQQITSDEVWCWRCRLRHQKWWSPGVGDTPVLIRRTTPTPASGD